jgi:cytochrome P450
MESDKTVFHEQEGFCLDKWLHNPRLPSFAFGFGKRACPGQHIGRRSLCIVISRLLWGLNVTGALDMHGTKIEVNAENMQ